ncbi:MAG: hypothetical protein HPY59_00930 [Anaerolineae bacterium]|nr:hypothetical protein [Anaerolineae bacterium]
MGIEKEKKKAGKVANFWVQAVATAGVMALVALLTPPEQTVGKNLGVILLHGAWVWAGLIFFGLAALAGLAGLLAAVFGKVSTDLLARGSSALAWTGMMFWLSYLPMSLWVMKVNWGGFFFDEPRWRIPFTFAVVGALLQAGLILVNRPVLTWLANLFFGAALWFSLFASQTVLHPESPVAQSDDLRIQATYGLLLGLALLLGGQVAWALIRFKKT